MRKILLALLCCGFTQTVCAEPPTNSIVAPEMALQFVPSRTTNQTAIASDIEIGKSLYLQLEPKPPVEEGILSLFGGMSYESEETWAGSITGTDTFFWSFSRFKNGTRNERDVTGEVGWFVRTEYPMSSVGPHTDSLCTGLAIRIYSFP